MKLQARCQLGLYSRESILGPERTIPRWIIHWPMAEKAGIPYHMGLYTEMLSCSHEIAADLFPRLSNPKNKYRSYHLLQFLSKFHVITPTHSIGVIHQVPPTLKGEAN